MPSRVKRVALTQALQRKQAATRGAMGLQTRDGIPRARRLEPALPSEEGPQEDLIRANERDEDPGCQREPNMRPGCDVR